LTGWKPSGLQARPYEMPCQLVLDLLLDVTFHNRGLESFKRFWASHMLDFEHYDPNSCDERAVARVGGDGGGLN